MSEILSITASEIEQFLQEKYGSGIADVIQIGEGGWSLAFAFVLEGARYVIRWSDVADNFERDAVAARFTSDSLQVPPITEIGQGMLRFFAISPFVGGTYLEALSAAELENMLPSLLKMLRALRAIDLSGTAGFGFWNKEGKGSHAMCYKLDIGIGSIAYNAFKKDWKNAEEAASYTLKLLG